MVPIKQAWQDLLIGATLTSVGAVVSELHQESFFANMGKYSHEQQVFEVFCGTRPGRQTSGTRRLFFGLHIVKIHKNMYLKGESRICTSFGDMAIDILVRIAFTRSTWI